MKPVLAAIVVLAVIGLALLIIPRLSSSPLTLNPSPSPTSSIPQTDTKSSISKGPTPTIPFSLPEGYTIHTFAQNLGNPRDLVFSPGGTLLVSNPSGNNILALPDTNQDAASDKTVTVIGSLNHPHGLAFHNGKLYIAQVNKVERFNWDEQNLKATLDKTLFSLPENGNHNNRTLAFDEAGNLYTSVGSTCNVCNEASNLSATVLISNQDGGNLRVFAKGLRNAPFILINPNTKELWGTEMGRDNLGDNLPPDEIDIIKEGADYGWPNCYGNKVPDKNFNPSAVCQNTQSPIFEIPAHSAPLGLTFINSQQFPTWQGDLFVSYHGSWNRSTPTGYKVVHMKVSGNTITSTEDFLTGFIQNGQTLARPVDIIFDNQGNLYVSDDRSGNVFIVQHI